MTPVYTNYLTLPLVVDFDSPDVQEAFDATLPHLTNTYQVTTPSGGRHYYYTASGLPAQMLDVPGRIIGLCPTGIFKELQN